MKRNEGAHQIESTSQNAAFILRHAENRFCLPILTVKQNNRDHRKIAVIDGKVAFTRGINLADEYINAIEKHGHWKDASIMVEGKAAWSFTLFFYK